MPLPKPLKRGASKKSKKRVVKETMHDLKHGPHHKDRTRKQEIAIAMKESGQSKKRKKRKSSADSKPRNLATKKTPKRKAANRKVRNKGR